jgi:hypothetical protein
MLIVCSSMINIFIILTVWWDLSELAVSSELAELVDVLWVLEELDEVLSDGADR